MTLKIFLLIVFVIGALPACNLPSGFQTSPTLTPSITPTLTPSATPTATLTPTPSATPVPAVRIVSGDQALFNGDYSLARQEYQIAYDLSADAKIKAASLWGMGKTNYQEGRYPDTLDNLRRLVSEHPDSDRTAYAYFILGRTYDQLDRFDEAADAYAQYLRLRPGILDSLVNEYRGDALFNAGRYAEAIEAYQRAIDAPHNGDNIILLIGIARAYALSGDSLAALKLYDEIAVQSQNDYVRAKMDFYSGQIYVANGETAKGYERYLHAVENYPLAPESYSALLALVEANQPVDDFQRGIVDYFAGQYDVAIEALDRFMASDPNHDGTALYYKALSLYYLQEYDQAILAWDEFMQRYPDNRYWAVAWYADTTGSVFRPGKAYTQWIKLSQYSSAAQTLQTFLSVAPGSALAVDYSMLAARILEHGGELNKAIEMWEALADSYPSDPAVPQALFNAGIVRYRQKDYSGALVDFQRSLLLANNNVEEQARAYLWIGKSQQKLGRTADAQSAWQTAQALDPFEYYGLRSRDLILGREPFAHGEMISEPIDLIKEKAEADAWIRIKFNLLADTDLNGLGSLLGDQRVWRGTELWELGLYDEAKAEFENVRASIKSDPVLTYRLGNHLVQMGLYRSGIYALRDVLTMAGLTDQASSLSAPNYFRHIRYGLYYYEIIAPVASEYDLDPLFVTSVVRQESLFEGFVRSSAGARGLMQVIPATGDDIAEKLGWPPNYTSEDLYSPHVSVRFGMDYIKYNLKLFDGSVYAALAAYNGGPGNTYAWNALADNDPDLLLEIIRAPETRDYIRYIYETQAIYRSLYTVTP